MDLERTDSDMRSTELICIGKARIGIDLKRYGTETQWCEKEGKGEKKTGTEWERRRKP